MYLGHFIFEFESWDDFIYFPPLDERGAAASISKNNV